MENNEDLDIERFDFHGLVMERRGRTISFEAGPNMNREALMGYLMARGETARRSASELIDRLRAILDEFDALHLLGQVALWATMGVSGIDDAENVEGREAQVEFLGGLALSIDEPAGELASPQAVQESRSLLSNLFEMERSRILGEELAEASGDVISDARYLLRLEDLSYRTQGYAPHLESILLSLFEPLRQECIDGLGFAVSDIPVLVEAIRARATERFELKSAEARAIDTSQFSDTPEEELAFQLLSWVVFSVVNPRGDWSVADLAAGTDIEPTQVESFLEAFTSEWRSQPDFGRPGEPNTLRRYPVLRGRDGRYSIQLIWSILHEVIPWFKGEIESRGLDVLRSQYLTLRGDKVEELVAGAMGTVFGEDRVLRNVEYPIGSGNWAETDVVVLLGNHAVVIEAKSNALHDAYRRGEAERIGHHVTDLVDRPVEQAVRAASYLKGGGTRFRRKGTTDTFEIEPVESVDKIAVSLERIDPLILLGHELSTVEGQGTWIVSLPDLLAICDVLDSAEALVAYAATRTEVATSPRARVFGEMDLLGAFLEDRLRGFMEALENGPEDVRAVLGHSAQKINVYFTQLAVGIESPKPGLALGEAEQRRLSSLYETRDPRWYQAALSAVLETP